MNFQSLGILQKYPTVEWAEGSMSCLAPLPALPPRIRQGANYIATTLPIRHSAPLHHHHTIVPSISSISRT